MSDNVIPLKEFKKPKIEKDNPCIVMFYFAPFWNEQDRRQSHTISVRVDNGDYEGIIDAAAEMGGLYAPEQLHGKIWFFPWPPAAISVHLIDAETGEMIPLT